jgi:hypothetical protein
MWAISNRLSFTEDIADVGLTAAFQQDILNISLSPGILIR